MGQIRKRVLVAAFLVLPAAIATTTASGDEIPIPVSTVTGAYCDATNGGLEVGDAKEAIVCSDTGSPAPAPEISGPILSVYCSSTNGGLDLGNAREGMLCASPDQTTARCVFLGLSGGSEVWGCRNFAGDYWLEIIR